MEKNQILRIDDRLIHGQVVVGWGSIIHPSIFLLIDDDIVNDDLEKDLYLLGIPDDYQGLVLSVKEGAAKLNELMTNQVSFVAVVRSPKVAFELFEYGSNFTSLNVGGMHSKCRKKEFNHYVYMNKEDFNFLEKLHSNKVDIYIQDLPRAKKYDFFQLSSKLQGEL